jgi:HPt (histidine-containing phosphotransfer) domain-containing protein
MSEFGKYEKIIRRLVNQAEQRMETEAKDYDPLLGDSLNKLRQAIREEAYEDAISIAYGIKGAAGTMGWPLASKAAGFMRHALEDKHKIDKAHEAIKVHMDTLDLIYRKRLKKEDQTGVQLIKDLHAMLLKYNIQPGA